MDCKQLVIRTQSYKGLYTNVSMKKDYYIKQNPMWEKEKLRSNIMQVQSD